MSLFHACCLRPHVKTSSAGRLRPCLYPLLCLSLFYICPALSGPHKAFIAPSPYFPSLSEPYLRFCTRVGLREGAKRTAPAVTTSLDLPGEMKNLSLSKRTSPFVFIKAY